MLRVILILVSPFILTLTSSEITSYEYLLQLITRYEYAMDPEQREDKSLITDLPKLYSDALKIHAAEQGGALDGNIVCALLIGIFKNHANIIKDQLAVSKSPYFSKKFVASTANWPTWLLEITLEQSLYNLTRECDDNTKTPVELACSLMLHRSMVMLTKQGACNTDLEQLYNCLLLCTVNSDVEGFDIIWNKLYKHDSYHGNSCGIVRKNISGTILSKALKDIYLSSLEVAYFQCKKSNCIMFDHMCKVLCHDLCSQQLPDPLSTITSYHIELSDTHHEQQLSCPHSYMHIINGYHGWRTGFTMETDKCQIPLVDIGQLSEEMLQLFAGIKQPLVIKGVGTDWNVSTKWTRKYLQKHFGSIEVLVCYSSEV